MVQHGSETQTADLAAALARIPSGLFVLTLPCPGEAGEPAGPGPLLVSFVQQVGFEPPRIVVALRKDRPIAAALRARDGFVLNVLGQEDGGLLKRFASSRLDPGTAFDGLNVERRAAGVVLCDAVAALECRVADSFDGGDHRLVVADVVAGVRLSDRAPYVHIRRDGLSY
ncbi:MAG: Diflavin flavoprotein A 1 [Phycisphaerae bacterium]|nr:Diflavin flavoprotein A 1 [Phycisphaerae bacterium]